MVKESGLRSSLHRDHCTTTLSMNQSAFEESDYGHEGEALLVLLVQVQSSELTQHVLTGS